MASLSLGDVNGLVRLAYLGHASAACPYLPSREARLLYLDGNLAGPVYRPLMEAGYRRNGTYLYRPDCIGCNECKVLRVPVQTFHRSREQRRVWNRGIKEFEIQITSPEYSDERAELYRRYLLYQHDNPESELPGNESYTSFLVDTCLAAQTRELQLWHDGRLAGVGIFDELADALSSVYFFFDPGAARFSPGTFSALVEIDLARQWNKDFYYLGYYIAECASMSYKARFRPCQIKDCAERWD